MPTIENSSRHKHELPVREGIFIGIQPDNNTYRILFPDRNVQILTAHVKFQHFPTRITK